jgi:SAM-dependent methyltransferase
MGYSALAPYYDTVMAHVDYGQWARLIQRVCEKYVKNPAPDIFEIGAGTGSLARLLLSMGFSYAGSDLSFDMCRQAKNKDLSFCCADGRHLPVRAQFDLVVFLYDGINYLFTEQEYGALFSEVHRILKPHGLFLFDITTQTNSMTYFQDQTDCEVLEDCYCMRHSYYDRIHSIQYNDFILFAKDSVHPDLFNRFSDSHAQTVLPAATIKRWIPKDRFSPVAVWDGYSSSPAHKHSERVHFLLKRK